MSRAASGAPVGVQDARGQSTVDEQGELAGEQVGVGGAGAAGKVGQPGPDTFVFDGTGVHAGAGG